MRGSWRTSGNPDVSPYRAGPGAMARKGTIADHTDIKPHKGVFPAPGSVNMQFDASNPLLTQASLVWRFVLDWVGGRGVSAAMHSALVTGRAKPP